MNDSEHAPEWTFKQWAYVGHVLADEGRLPPANQEGYALAMSIWRAEGRREPPGGEAQDPIIAWAGRNVLLRQPIPPQPSAEAIAWARGGDDFTVDLPHVKWVSAPFGWLKR